MRTPPWTVGHRASCLHATPFRVWCLHAAFPTGAASPSGPSRGGEGPASTTQRRPRSAPPRRSPAESTPRAGGRRAHICKAQTGPPARWPRLPSLSVAPACLPNKERRVRGRHVSGMDGSTPRPAGEKRKADGVLRVSGDGVGGALRKAGPVSKQPPPGHRVWPRGWRRSRTHAGGTRRCRLRACPGAR